MTTAAAVSTPAAAHAPTRSILMLGALNDPIQAVLASIIAAEVEAVAAWRSGSCG